MGKYKISLIEGDNIGPELISQVRKVLAAIDSVFDLDLEVLELEAFGKTIDGGKGPMPQDALNACQDSQAVVVGNIGEKRFSDLAKEDRPEGGFLQLRKAVGVSAGLRKVKIQPALAFLSPLKDERVQGLDIAIIRDLEGGMYSGIKTQEDPGQDIWDYEFYNEEIILNSTRHAFNLAKTRRNKVTSLDKSNVLSTGALWRQVVTDFAKTQEGVSLDHDYADNAAMGLLQAPRDYDVILTNNVFGDILADELTAISGSPSIFANSELAPDGRGIYTPNQLHYPKEEDAGKDIVSPLGIVSALSDLFTFSIVQVDVAKAIDRAIDASFEEGLTTPDLPIEGFKEVGTSEMGDFLASRIKK